MPENVIDLDIQTLEPSRIRLAALGDTGTGNTDQKQVAEALAKVCLEEGCDLVLMLGDNFYPNGLSGIEDPLFKSVFLDVYRGLKIPVIPVLGNHDVKGSSSAQVLQSLLHPEWKMPNYSYFFDKEPVRFHGINSNCHLYAWYRLYRDLSGREDQKVNSLRQQAKWTVVFGHHPVFSNGVHGDSGLIQRLVWERLLGDRVDFYLSGHDHQLAHLSRERGKTQYLVSGAGGAHYRDPEERKNLKDSAALSHFTHHDNGFLWMDIAPGKALSRFYDLSGQVLYETVQTKQDQRQ